MFGANQLSHTKEREDNLAGRIKIKNNNNNIGIVCYEFYPNILKLSHELVKVHNFPAN